MMRRMMTLTRREGPPRAGLRPLSHLPTDRPPYWLAHRPASLLANSPVLRGCWGLSGGSVGPCLRACRPAGVCVGRQVDRLREKAHAALPEHARVLRAGVRPLLLRALPAGAAQLHALAGCLLHLHTPTAGSQLPRHPPARPRPPLPSLPCYLVCSLR